MGSPEQRVVHSSVDPNWRTPADLFAKLHAEAHFEIDLAADAQTCLLRDGAGAYYYGPDHPHPAYRDGLTATWSQDMPGGVGYLNMPYSVKLYRETQNPAYQIASWVKKAYDESLKGFTTYALVPFSPQTIWYRRYIMGHGVKVGPIHCASEIRRFPYRVQFDPSPAYAAHMLNELSQGRRKSGQVSSAGHNVVVVIFKPNPGYVGPWQPVERYWSYR